MKPKAAGSGIPGKPSPGEPRALARGEEEGGILQGVWLSSLLQVSLLCTEVMASLITGNERERDRKRALRAQRVSGKTVGVLQCHHCNSTHRKWDWKGKALPIRQEKANYYLFL